MLDWGAFWAVNMLFVERLHVLLKKMGAGHKDRMQTFVNHYDLWDSAQSEWRWTGSWTTKPKKSTMAGYQAVPENDNKTVAKGARKTIVLSKGMHLQVLEMFAVENKRFDVLLDKYKAYIRAARRKQGSRARNAPLLELADWRPTGAPLRDDEAAWLKTPHTVQALYSVILTFCTDFTYVLQCLHFVLILCTF
jgi:hypothetical protein